MTQNSSERSNPRITCDRNRRTIMSDRHRPKLMTINEFAILAHTFLHEKRRPSRDLHFHHNCHDHQYRPQEQQPQQGHHPIKNPFKYHSYYQYFLVSRFSSTKLLHSISAVKYQHIRHNYKPKKLF